MSVASHVESADDRILTAIYCFVAPQFACLEGEAFCAKKPTTMAAKRRKRIYNQLNFNIISCLA
ncbi:hypothetical protein DWB84_18575 [Saccharophagus sp. K07]|nr:hypothetical protein [Saccharophagus sp. K07]